MATTCPAGFDAEKLREEVSKMYARVAEAPEGDFHFHRGPAYAAEWLSYDATALSLLPRAATASFAGVANPLKMSSLRPGMTVLDLGSGSGMDLLLAAKQVGHEGRAIGVDMTPSMMALARSSAQQLGFSWVEVREGLLENLPVESGSVDVVISNGVVNLSVDKEKTFGEVLRVLKPGGELLLGDIVVSSELSEKIRSDIELWTG